MVYSSRLPMTGGFLALLYAFAEQTTNIGQMVTIYSK